jgi:hypothetical protein
MALVKTRTISYEDFLKLREASDDKLEFIDHIPGGRIMIRVGW